MRRSLVFWLVLTGYALLWQPGIYMNDEVLQAAGLWSLADGSYDVVGDDLPEAYRAAEEPFSPWTIVPGPGATGPPIGSDLLNLVAWPVHSALRPIAHFIGVLPTLGLVAAGAFAATIRASQTAGGLRPNRALAPAVAAVAWAASWHSPSVAMDPFLQIASIQVVNATAMAAAAMLIWDVLRRHVDVRTATATALLFAFGTPALFWALNLKYHGLAMALSALAIWAYRDGFRSSARRTALAFMACGLALSTHLPSGAVLLASTGLMAGPVVALGWRPALRRARAGAMGLAVGLLPEVAFRVIRYRLELRERYLAVAPGVDAGEELQSSAARGYLSHGIWNGPIEAVEALSQFLLGTNFVDHQITTAVPALALVPLLVAVPFVLRSNRLPKGLLVWPLAHLAMIVVLVGQGMLRIGAGFDLRHNAGWWPFAALWLALPVAVLLREPRAARQGAAGIAIVVGFVLAGLFMLRQARGDFVFATGPGFEVARTGLWIGLAVAATVALVHIDRWGRAWRAPVLGAAFAWAIILRLMIAFGPGRQSDPAVTAPFVLWPVDALGRMMQFWILGP